MISLRKLRICLRSLRTLVRFPFRTLLTVLSAALGVAGAAGSVSYALGGRAKLLDQLDRLGANVLIVSPRQSRTVAGRARTGSIVQTLAPADLLAIRRENLPVSRMSATFQRAFLIKVGDLAKNNSTVLGVEPAFFAIKHWSAAQGSLFTLADDRRAARVALLGSTLARELFGDSPVGARISIDRVPFVVAGVLAERGQGLDAANEDSQVYVPLGTALRRLANADYFSSILLEARGTGDLDSAAEAVRTILRRRHRSPPKLGDDFDVQNQKQVVETQAAVSLRLASYARWIGICAMAVSGLGVLAIAWIGVRERTGETGTRRALGATRSDILMQFAFEALAPALAGCLLGLAIAWECAPLLARWADQPLRFDWPSARVSCTLSIVLNAAFALLPAAAAACMDPIEALHFE